MARESIEKSNIDKGERGEKSVIERLKEIKEKEEIIKKENPTYGTPWSVINPEKLSQEALELYELYDKGDIKAAEAEISVVRDKLKEIKNKEEKENNEQFINWIDDKIGSKFLGDQLEEDKQKDYTR